MTFEAALRTELMTITSLNNKVFPMRAPEGMEAPYLIYTTTLGDYDKSLEGWHKSKGVTVELNVIHDRASAVRALGREVQALVMGLDGKRYYYPASMEYGFITRDGGYVPGYHYLRDALVDNKAEIERVTVDELAKRIDKLR